MNPKANPRASAKHKPAEKSDKEMSSEPDSDDEDQDNSYEADSFIAESDEESDEPDFDEDDNDDEAAQPLAKRSKPSRPAKRRRRSLGSDSEKLGEEFEQKNKTRLKKISQKDRKPAARPSSEEPEEEEEAVSDDNFVEGEAEDSAGQLPPAGRKPANPALERLFGPEQPEPEPLNPAEPNALLSHNVELHAIFEPGDLAQHFETPRDLFIVQADRPERQQMRIKNFYPPSNEELVEETRWITAKVLERNNLLPAESGQLFKQVIKILEYLTLNAFEVMYIWSYKQPEFVAEQRGLLRNYELRLADIWFMYELHAEWVELYRRHRTIAKQFDVLTQHLPLSQNLRLAMGGCFDRTMLGYFSDFVEYNLKKFLGSEEINRILESSAGESLPKKMEQRSLSFEIQQLGLHKMAESVSLSAEQLAENLGRNERLHAAPFLQESPEVVAHRCCRSDIGFLQDPLRSLSTLCQYIACEYFHHPIVRKWLNKTMMDRVTIGTRPTDRGKSLSVYDHLYPAKRILGKRPGNVSRELWLLVLEAETKGLVEVSFGYGAEGGGRGAEVEQKLKYFLLANPARKEVDKFDMLAAWDLVRAEIVTKLFKDYVFADFEFHLRRELTESAEKAVIAKCCSALRELVNVRPYKADQPNMAILALSNDEETATYAVINEDGELIDSGRLMHIMRKATDQDLSHRVLLQQDVDVLKQLIGTYHLKAIVVAPKNHKSRHLKLELVNITATVYETSPNLKPFVMWGNISVAGAFAASPMGARLMKDHSPLVREAVSIARYIQNPLAETLNLWHENERENMLLHMGFSPFQHQVSQFKLKNEFENLLVEVVNRAGVDINQCVRFPHFAAQLQFLCGLGPRKAKKLIDQLKADNVVVKRRAALKDKYLKENVFNNAAGFVRIDSKLNLKHLTGPPDEDYNLLDFTRIHPHFYDIAQKIISQALDEPAESPNKAFLAVLNDLDKLKNLELEEFSHHLSQRFGQNMKLVVDLILEELGEPFKDSRPSFPTQSKTEEIFYRVSGESPFHLLEESLVNARVLSINEKGVKVVTDSGLMGFINKSNIRERDNDLKDAELRAMFPVGLFVRAKVRKIDFEHFKLQLSLLAEHLANHREFVRKNEVLERYGLSEGNTFAIVPEEDYPVVTLEGRKRVNRFLPRKISHPFFKNIGLASAQEFLAERRNGEFLFRPSSKGADFLNLTWRLFDEVFAHLVIKEGFKGPQQELSASLAMDKREFESLDDIVANYLRPCNNIIEGIARNEKFLAQPVESVKQLLAEEKNLNASKIPYYFSFSAETPQFLVLSYIVQKLAVKHELIKIKPDGLLFHGLSFSNLAHLIKYFKENLKTKEYMKYTESLPKVEFGARAKLEAKEESKDERYGRNRRSSRYSDDSSSDSQRRKRDYSRNRSRDASHAKKEQRAGHGQAHRRRQSDSSLESVSQSPKRREKHESRDQAKEEAYNYAPQRNFRSAYDTKGYNVKYENTRDQ